MNNLQSSLDKRRIRCRLKISESYKNLSTVQARPEFSPSVFRYAVQIPVLPADSMPGPEIQRQNPGMPEKGMKQKVQFRCQILCA